MAIAFCRTLPARTLGAVTLCLALSTSAFAAEGSYVSLQPGAIGTEMTLPALLGVYVQLVTSRYSSSKFAGDDGQSPSVPFAVPGVPVAFAATLNARVSAQGFAPRIVWVTREELLGGRVVLDATLPMLRRETTVSLVGNGLGVLPAQLQTLVQAGLNQQAASISGKTSGQGDAEFRGFVDWSGDESRVAAGLSLTAPTGRYNALQPVNIGVNYWTVRPWFVITQSWSNGLEAAAYVTYSLNTRNGDTKVRTGQYAHTDANVLYRLNESFRLGVHGYGVIQTTADNQAGASIAGNKLRVFGAGPVVSYLSDGLNWGADLKVIREFGARNRSEGTAVWLRAQYRF